MSTTLFSHVSMFYDPRICSLYSIDPRKQQEKCVYYSYIEVDTWKVWWSYTRGIIHINHCSSQYISHETLLIPVLFIRALFIVLTSVNFFLFFEFIPMKVRYWRLMSNAKYRMEHNHATD
jgi:hypothetical protein